MFKRLIVAAFLFAALTLGMAAPAAAGLTTDTLGLQPGGITAPTPPGGAGVQP